MAGQFISDRLERKHLRNDKWYLPVAATDLAPKELLLHVPILLIIGCYSSAGLNFENQINFMKVFPTPYLSILLTEVSVKMEVNQPLPAVLNIN